MMSQAHQWHIQRTETLDHNHADISLGLSPSNLRMTTFQQSKGLIWLKGVCSSCFQNQIQTDNPPISPVVLSERQQYGASLNHLLVCGWARFMRSFLVLYVKSAFILSFYRETSTDLAPGFLHFHIWIWTPNKTQGLMWQMPSYGWKEPQGPPVPTPCVEYRNAIPKSPQSSAYLTCSWEPLMKKILQVPWTALLSWVVLAPASLRYPVLKSSSSLSQ